MTGRFITAQDGALIPVATGCVVSNGTQISSSSAALMMGTRTLHYCPLGITGGIKLLYSPIKAAPDETDATIAMPINVGVEANCAAPHDIEAAYVIGDKVTYGRQEYQAAADNTGVIPGPATTATWTATAFNTPSPVPFKGTRAGKMAAATTPGGATVVEDLLSDLIPCEVEPGGWLALNTFISQPSGNNVIPLGRQTKIIDGEYLASGPSIGDRSITGTVPIATALNGLNYIFTPVAILGRSSTVKRDVPAIVADSLGNGDVGKGAAAITINAGGTGFTANDVGKIGTVGTTGASAGAVNSPIMVQICAVSGGAVTTLWLLDGGSMANTTNLPSATLPSTTGQAVTFADAAGAGLTINWTLGDCLDSAGKKGAQGYWQRAFVANDYPTMNFVRGSDSLTRWAARDYARMALMEKAGINAVLDALGVNDVITGGYTAATVIALITARNARYRAAGVNKVIKATITPHVTVSTDAFLTLGNQTVSAYNDMINTINDAIRAGTVGNDGYVDASDAACSARGSGKFKVDGVTPGLMVADGIHFSYTGIPIMAAAMAAEIGTLFN